jgi:hypothetical protein
LRRCGNRSVAASAARLGGAAPALAAFGLALNALQGWTENKGDTEEAVSLDHMLDDITLYSLGFEKTDACLVLRYSASDEKVEQRLGLICLPRNFGRTLTVAVCPHCRQRARVLYYARRRFVCRRCTGAVYASKGQSAPMRAMVRFRKLRERIRPGTWNAELDYFPRRPKRMRRATYGRVKVGRARCA